MYPLLFCFLTYFFVVVVIVHKARVSLTNENIGTVKKPPPHAFYVYLSKTTQHTFDLFAFPRSHTCKKKERVSLLHIQRVPTCIQRSPGAFRAHPKIISPRCSVGRENPSSHDTLTIADHAPKQVYRKNSRLVFSSFLPHISSVRRCQTST